MNQELKIFLYWLTLTVIFYVLARIEHKLSGSSLYFKYYEGIISPLYWLLLGVGVFVISVWLFVQFTSYFFTGELILIE